MARTRFDRVDATGSLEDRRYCQLLRSRASERKLRLLDCAIIRHAPFDENGRTIWELPPTVGIEPARIIEIFERFADGDADENGMEIVRNCFRHAERSAEADRFGYDEDRLVGSETRYGVADWLEAIVRPVADYANLLDYYILGFDGESYSWGGYSPLHAGHRCIALKLISEIFGNPFRPSTIAAEWLTWSNGTVPKLAQTIYDDRRYDIMPILGDALEDAGCADAQILDHCRGPEPHVRGCWVIDLILGKN